MYVVASPDSGTGRVTYLRAKGPGWTFNIKLAVQFPTPEAARAAFPTYSDPAHLEVRPAK